MARCVSMNSQATLTQDELKKLVGYKAVDDYVRSNMVVGLGTGSTAYFAVERGRLNFFQDIIKLCD